MPSEISVDDETATRLLQQMLRIKAFEDETKAPYEDGEIPGFVHLDHGHEGNHVGIGAAMEDDDWLAVGGARLVGQYVRKRSAIDGDYGRTLWPCWRRQQWLRWADAYCQHRPEAVAMLQRSVPGRIRQLVLHWQRK